MLTKHLRWLNHYRTTLIALLLGVMLATGLVATGQDLIEQVLTFALRRVLLNAPVQDAHLQLSLRRAMDEPALSDVNGRLRTTLTNHLTPLPHDIILSGNLPTLIPWQDEQPITSQRLNVQFYEADVQTKVTVIAGEWPAAEQLAADRFAVVIGQPLAEAHQLQVGDRLPLSKQSDAILPDMWLEVAAIVQPIDGQDPFWFGEFSPLRTRDDGRFRHYGALISPETFLHIAATHFATQSPQFHWNILIDADQLELADVARLQARLATLPDQLLQTESTAQLITGLPQTIADFAQNADTVRTPLTFLTTTSTLLAFFFVGMVATLAGGQFDAEWTLHRHRGLRESRLFWTHFGRMGSLVLLAYWLGLQLSAGLLRGLEQAGPLADIREPTWTFTGSQTGWRFALLAAFFCLILIFWPYWQSRRQLSTRALQSIYRPEQTGWFQRYYVDVFIVLIGLILLARFVGQGGLIQATTGNNRADWLLVLAPISTMIGGLMILLRLFPSLLTGLSRLLRSRPQTSPYLALIYAARSHQQATRIVLLFALTIALGIFSSSVDDALRHNEEIRARYATGGAARLIGLNSESGLLAGVEKTAVWRGEAVVDSAFSQSFSSFELLAIEPEPFAQTVSLRPNFAPQPIPDLLDKMIPPNLGTGSSLGNSLPIPPTATSFAIWLTMPSEDPVHWQGISLDIKVATADNDVFLLPLTFNGNIDGVWRQFSVDLPSPPPAQLDSIWLRSRTYRPTFRQNLAYDDLTISDATGQETLLEGFENLSDEHDVEHDGRFWFSVDPEQTNSLFFFPSPFQPRSGDTRLELSFGTGGIAAGQWYGTAPFDLAALDTPVLPVLVSQQFAAMTGTAVNEQLALRVRQSPVNVQSIFVQIVGIIDYFPTLYEQPDTGYVITLLDPLLFLFNSTRHTPMQPNELLLSQPPSPALRNQAAAIVDVTEVAETLRAFPLAVGLRTASRLSYILATAISLGGFIAHLVFTVSQRRSQFALLRAIGLNASQLYRMLLIEQLVLLLFGLLLGTALGLLLTWLTLNNLNFDWGGFANEPPFEAVWDWQALLRTYALFGAMVLFALTAALLMIRRAGLQHTLRMVVE